MGGGVAAGWFGIFLLPDASDTRLRRTRFSRMLQIPETDLFVSGVFKIMFSSIRGSLPRGPQFFSVLGQEKRDQAGPLSAFYFFGLGFGSVDLAGTNLRSNLRV